MEPEDIVRRAVEIAAEKKGEDLKVLDVSTNLGITDYFVLVTADSRRQAQAIAAEIDTRLKHEAQKKARIEGFGEGWWVLLDLDSVVVHVFQREARDFYRLDDLWAEAADRTGDFVPPASGAAG